MHSTLAASAPARMRIATAIVLLLAGIGFGNAAAPTAEAQRAQIVYASAASSQGTPGARTRAEYDATNGFSNSATPPMALRDPKRPINTVAAPAGYAEPYAGAPYQVAGKWYVPMVEQNYDETGVASWYGPNFHGKASATGEVFDTNAMTAAHPTLPIPSLARVTNLENGKSVIVRINDRGPFVDDRLIDMSNMAAKKLEMTGKGTAKVRVQYVGPAPAAANTVPSEFELAKLSTAPAALSSQPRIMPPPVDKDPLFVSPKPTPVKVAQAAPETRDTSLARDSVIVASQPLPSASEQMSARPLLPSKPAATIATANVPSGWYVQAGAFSDVAKAEAAGAQLSPFGKAYIEPASVNGKQMYRVLMGRANKADAELLQRNLASTGRQTLIVAR